MEGRELGPIKSKSLPISRYSDEDASISQSREEFKSTPTPPLLNPIESQPDSNGVKVTVTDPVVKDELMKKYVLYTIKVDST